MGPKTQIQPIAKSAIAFRRDAVLNETRAPGCKALRLGTPTQGSARMTLARAAVVSSLFMLLAGSPSFSATAVEEIPRNLSCKFETGNTWTYEAGKFQSAPPSALSLEIQDINLEAQAAKLIDGEKPAGTLRIVRALNANHFLEVANEGFLNLTTIYDLDTATGNYPAVHSRHFGLMGQPIFAQYAGFCKAK